MDGELHLPCLMFSDREKSCPKGFYGPRADPGMQALCEGRDRSSTYPGSTLPRPLRQRASSKRSMTALSALYEHARDTRTSRCLRAGERHVSFSKNGLGMLSKRCFGRTGKQGMRGTVARVELRTPGRRNKLLASPWVGHRPKTRARSPPVQRMLAG